ncbi:hypothetical protein E2C01_011484 [Portunus trituberculatus]|uniref:Uncharacterized protein n=1 Tax=Portunus trituberculatus TaxID=210409 RepID=A0A5B7DBF6_PORTR|nr:hypothetical protein [Portunus trituberculatus]
MHVTLRASPHLLSGVQFRVAGWQTHKFMSTITNYVVHHVLRLWPVLLAEEQQLSPCGARWDGYPPSFQPADEVWFSGRCGGSPTLLCQQDMVWCIIQHQQY